MDMIRITAADDVIARVDFDGWGKIPATSLPLVPTPLAGNPAIERISPFIAKSTDHGSINKLEVAAAHNGTQVAIRLSWASAKHDVIADLDQFVDGVAVMFPLHDDASAFTMGAPGTPVNAWYWKANAGTSAFDVVAEGYGTSARHRDHERPIACDASHDGEHWHVVLSRTLAGATDRALFSPGTPARVAFAVWDGGNRERAGRKSFSGDFMPLNVAE